MAEIASVKPIKLYGHRGGPNPWKVAIILEELGLPYDTEFVDFKEIKNEPFISVNPNGRVPAIEDPNTGLTVWESGAIIQYLVNEYDKDNKISYSTKAQKYDCDQWLFFQVSGQGPYYGQWAWFSRFHHEKLPSAIERYKNEIVRVASVIDLQLQRTGKPYLVGDKATYADLSFIPWAAPMAAYGMDVTEGGSKNKLYQEWLGRLTARAPVAKVLKEKEEASK